MNGVLILAFAMIFVAGPAIVWRLARAAPSGAVVRVLGLVVVALTLCAFVAQALGLAIVPPVLLWGAWVVSMALMVQVSRLVMGAGAGDKWTAMAGAVGSTIPWFGILVARTMAG